MSGGQWYYVQDKLHHIAVDIPIWMNRNAVDDEVTRKFIEAVAIIKQAAVYIERIDWFMSGDDGEEEFIKRLQEDLASLQR